MIEYLNLVFMQIYVFFAYGEIQGIISMNMITLAYTTKPESQSGRCAMGLPTFLVDRLV